MIIAFNTNFDEGRRIEAERAKKWPRIWNLKCVEYVNVTKEMMDKAWDERVVSNFGSKNISEYDANILAYSGALGELVLLKYFGTGLIRRVGGTKHDFESINGKVKIEAKSIAAERIYLPEKMLFLVVKRSTAQEFDYIVFMHIPKQDIIHPDAIICGFQTRKQYEEEKVAMDAGVSNGIIKCLKWDNWGVDYKKMQPIGGLKAVLLENGGIMKSEEVLEW